MPIHPAGGRAQERRLSFAKFKLQKITTYRQTWDFAQKSLQEHKIRALGVCVGGGGRWWWEWVGTGEGDTQREEGSERPSGGGGGRLGVRCGGVSYTQGGKWSQWTPTPTPCAILHNACCFQRWGSMPQGAQEVLRGRGSPDAPEEEEEEVFIHSLPASLIPCEIGTSEQRCQHVEILSLERSPVPRWWRRCSSLGILWTGCWLGPPLFMAVDIAPPPPPPIFCLAPSMGRYVLLFWTPCFGAL